MGMAGTQNPPTHTLGFVEHHDPTCNDGGSIPVQGSKNGQLLDSYQNPEVSEPRA